MVLTITGNIKTIIMQLQGMEAYYGELVCTVIAEEKGEEK